MIKKASKIKEASGDIVLFLLKISHFIRVLKCSFVSGREPKVHTAEKTGMRSEDIPVLHGPRTGSGGRFLFIYD